MHENDTQQIYTDINHAVRDLIIHNGIIIYDQK